MTISQEPAMGPPPKKRRPRVMVLLIASLVVVAITFVYRSSGARSGPESEDLTQVFNALQAKWPDPTMRVGRRQLGARRAVVVWFVANAYVERAKPERDALATEAIAMARGAILAPSLDDVTHVCVVFAKEEHNSLSYASAGAGSCSPR